MFESDVALARTRTWILFAATSMLAITIPRFQGFSIDFTSLYLPYVLACIFAPFLLYTQFREMRQLHAALECTVIIFCILTPTLALSYSAMRIDLPMADNKLGALDHSIGWSTVSFVHLMQRYPAFCQLLQQVYNRLLPLALSVPLALALSGKIERCYQVVLSYIAVNLISFVVSIFFPSNGALVGQGMDPGYLLHTNLRGAVDFLTPFHNVRDLPQFILSADNASGIITFPSLHAAMAALFIWGIWPLRFVRYPVIVLSILMMISALVCGAHYLVDVIAGNLVVLLVVRYGIKPRATLKLTSVRSDRLGRSVYA